MDSYSLWFDSYSKAHPLAPIEFDPFEFSSYSAVDLVD